eukprot:COSAG04_NODE_3863_length_2464_cov_3.895045_3_plen_198_part_00
MQPLLEASKEDAKGAAALTPAHGALAADLLHQSDRLPDLLPLLLPLHDAVVLPAVAVAAHVKEVWPRQQRLRRLRQPLHRQGAGHDGGRHAALRELAQATPEAHPRAVFEHGLGGQIADATRRVGGALDQAGLRGGVPVAHGGLRALLEVDDEVHRDPGAAGPLGVGRGGAVPDEVAHRPAERHVELTGPAVGPGSY